MRIFYSLLLSALVFTLSSCSLWQHWFGHSPPPPPSAVLQVSPAARVAAIRAAGQREAAAKDTAIDVAPLRDPGVAGWQAQAQRDEQAGHYQAEAAALDQALKLNPQAPDLLQDRAEAAVLLGDYAQAESLARRSWSLGAQIGPICAKNWQTVAEMRQQAGDGAGMTAAENAVKQCHKAGIPRY